MNAAIELGRSMETADKYTAQIERDLGIAKAITTKSPISNGERGRSQKKCEKQSYSTKP